jgi:SAM-dependent methyltransferase
MTIGSPRLCALGLTLTLLFASTLACRPARTRGEAGGAPAVRAPPTTRPVAPPTPATAPTARVAPLDPDRYRRPDQLVAALGLAPGARVADVGAGGGYLTHRLAARAGTRGRVVATDIDPAALARIGAAAPGEAPITVRRVAPDDPGLERGGFDLILLSEVDHLLADRATYLRRLAAALAPDGRIAITNRRVYRAPLLAAARSAGLSPVVEYDGLPAHFLVEVKP